jgi:hypothetical protein
MLGKVEQEDITLLESCGRVLSAWHPARVAKVFEAIAQADPIGMSPANKHQESKTHQYLACHANYILHG